MLSTKEMRGGDGEPRQQHLLGAASIGLATKCERCLGSRPISRSCPVRRSPRKLRDCLF